MHIYKNFEIKIWSLTWSAGKILGKRIRFYHSFVASLHFWGPGGVSFLSPCIGAVEIVYLARTGMSQF